MKRLRAGELTLSYDRGFLRYIRCGHYEILRMIYFALRDHNWDTMPGLVSNEILNISDRSFHITYDWESIAEEFPFRWKVNIRGETDSSIFFEIEGSPQKDVRKNRTGFCILHSIEENAGKPCTILSPTGIEEILRFPDLISPHQPFLNIRSMKWPLSDWGEAVLEFEGDIFETEDQRNWTDDSYKTYCTPLSRPFPALLKEGEVVKQKVILSLDWHTRPDTSFDSTCRLWPSSPLHKPRMGLAARSDHQALSPHELRLIKRVKPDHYRVEIDLTHDRWRNHWQTHGEEVDFLDTDLELVLIFDDQYRTQVASIIELIAKLPPQRKIYLHIYHQDHKTTPSHLIDHTASLLRSAHRNLLIGAGTLAYFTELNREHVAADPIDFVNYSVNPQVHAFDNPSLVENAIAQGYTVESAHAIYPSKEVFVSPITLKPRFNPNATSADEPLAMDELPTQVDPRQCTPFAALWLVSSIIALSKSKADLVTYFETTGWTGICQGDQSPSSNAFPAKAGDIFPIFHILQFFSKHRDSEWLSLESNRPLSAQGIIFRQGKISTFIIVNLKAETVQVQLHLSTGKLRYTKVTPDIFAQHIQRENLFSEIFAATSQDEVQSPQLFSLEQETLILGRLDES